MAGERAQILTAPKDNDVDFRLESAPFKSYGGPLGEQASDEGSEDGMFQVLINAFKFLLRIGN